MLITNEQYHLKWSHVLLILVTAYLLLTVLFASLGYQHDLDRRVRGADGVYYYVYLPSIILDGDVDFENDLYTIYDPSFHIERTANGLAANVFSIGPAIMWSPFFLLGHLITWLSRLWGGTFPMNGFSYFYTSFVYIGNSLYACLGVLFTALFLRNFVRPLPALLACLVILTASQLTYYFWSFSTMSHNVSMAMAALFLYMWSKKGLHPATALVAALMILARWQNALLLLPVLFTSMNSLLVSLKNHELLHWLKHNGRFAILLVIGFAPQSAVWWVLYDNPVVIPQGNTFIEFHDLAIWQVLFSSNHGLFTWHPMLLVGTLGLALLWKHNHWLTLALSGVLVLQLLLNASVNDWWAGWSFGHRRFISTLPIMALGLALVLERLSNKKLLWAAIVLCVFAGWNQLFIYQYRNNLIPHSQPLTLREMVFDKLRLPAITQAKQLTFEAMAALQRKNMDVYHQKASQAYALSPDFRGIRPVYALSCLLSSNQQEGVRVFEEWLAQEPQELLARWGLATMYVWQGNFQKAALIFPDNSSASPVDTIIRAKINQQQTQLLDRDFFERYSAYIKKEMSHNIEQ